jgi:Uncharacterized protein conserved in bacteria
MPPSQKIILPYQVSHHPTTELSPEKEELFYQLREQAIKGKRRIIEKLLKNIKKYPYEPSLKNYLYVAYKMKGREEEASKLLKKTIEIHPKYFFAKVSLAEEYLDKGEPEKVPEVLGESLKLEILCPDQKIFHITEVTAFCSVVILYFIEIKEWKKAEYQLKILKQVGASDAYERMELRLQHAVLANSLERMRTNVKQEIVVDSYPIISYRSTEKPPVLQHELLRAFYQYSGKDFPAELIDQVIALPRESLIEDLNLIIEDSICRFDWFTKNYKSYNAQEQEFSTHGLYFAAALKATDCLPTILKLLQQGEEGLSYWFGDELESIFFEPIYLLGESRLSELREFIITPHLFFTVRLVVAKSVAQIAFHQPERKAEIVSWFRGVLNYHLAHFNDEGIIDTRFLAWTVSYFSKFAGPEEIPLIEKLWNKGWIPEHYLGSLEEIIESFKESMKDYNKAPMPENIYEFYSKIYFERRIEKVLTPEEERRNKEMLDDLKNNPIFKKFSEMMRDGGLPQNKDNNLNEEYLNEVNNYPPLPNTRTKPTVKIGRNQLCPCGSGKKYKKCCLS